MLTCAIPTCHASQPTLRSGSLYLVDVVGNPSGSNDRRISRRFVWLCPDCAQGHIVETWRPPGQQIRKIPTQSRLKRNSNSRDLELLHGAFDLPSSGIRNEVP